MVPSVRPAAVAGFFYPAEPEACDRAVTELIDAAVPAPAGLVVRGAIAPHAGWSYSGRTMARALRPLAAADPDLLVLFGADHRGLDGPGARVAAAAEWETPLGTVPVATDLAAALEDAGAARRSDAAHAPEHSLEVLVPVLHRLLPGTPVLPVLVPPGAGARSVGEAVVRRAVAAGRRPVVVGSTDLTHYGVNYGFTPHGTGSAARDWSRENDGHFLERIRALDPEGIEESARRRRNACGPGAAAAAVAAARALGAGRAIVLEHTTSADVKAEPDPQLWVGYAAVLLVD